MQPGNEIGVGGDEVAALVFGREERRIGGLREAAAVQQHAGLLAGRAHEAAERLVDLLHAGNLVHPAERGFAAEARALQPGHAGALEGIHLRQRRPDHHGVSHAAAEQIDALGKAAAEHEKERVGQLQ